MSFLTNILSSVQPLTAFSIFIIGWYVISAIYSWYRLRHIPGPFIASFSYLPLAWYALTGRQLQFYDATSKKYGSLIRIGPNEIMTDDPEVLKYLSGAKSKYWKSGWYTGSRFNPYHPSMFMTLDPIPHDKVKAQLLPGYSGRDNPSVEADIDAQLNSLIHLIRRKYITMPGREGYRPLDLARTVGFFALDVISKLSLGEAFGCLETDSDRHRLSETLDAAMPFIIFSADVPWARKIMYSTLALKLFGPKESDSRGMGQLMNLANDSVREYFKPDAVRDEKRMLGSWVRHGLTQIQCEVETLFMFVAGTDTTATAIRITILHILATPRVYQRLKSEIASAVQDGKASHPITQAEARTLPYLQAVVYEGLRIRPATTSHVSKEVPRGGDTINGKFIPEGTAIGLNFLPLLRSKAMFGEDADVFRPERYLEVDENTCIEMQRHVELHFGYGRWMCAGKPIAIMELNKIFFELLRYFDFQLVEPMKPMVTYSHGLYVDRGLLVRVTESNMAS
ncbi:cytochrome P450 [Hypoxylon sp. FL0890]|nr:cytochrome P450 [Hypoxylon sp. FL0890]